MKLFLNRTIGTWNDYYRSNPFFKRITGVLGVDILVKASAFLLMPLYLRLMSQDEFGLYNYLISIVQTFSLILNLGLYIPQTKLYHSLKTEKEKETLSFTLIITLLLINTVICLPIVLFGWDFLIIDLLFKNSFLYHKYRVLVLLALPVSIMVFMLTNFFYASEKIRQVKTYNIYRIAFINVVTLMALYWIHSDAVLLRLGYTYAVEFILCMLFGYTVLKHMIPAFDFKLMMQSLKMGLPFMVSALFGVIINFSDKFFLEKYGTLKDLSNYYLALSFAGIIPLVFASLQNVWMPVFMKEKSLENNIRKTKALISKLLLLFTGLSLVIWLAFEFFIWKGIIPDKYSQVTFILPIILLTQVIVALSAIYGNYLIYFERTQLVSYAALFISIISLGTGLWIIPKWGIYGAAFSSLISNCAYLIVYYGLAMSLKRKHLKINSLKEVQVYEYST